MHPLANATGRRYPDDAVAALHLISALITIALRSEGHNSCARASPVPGSDRNNPPSAWYGTSSAIPLSKTSPVGADRWADHDRENETGDA